MSNTTYSLIRNTSYNPVPNAIDKLAQVFEGLEAIKVFPSDILADAFQYAFGTGGDGAPCLIAQQCDYVDWLFNAVFDYLYEGPSVKWLETYCPAYSRCYYIQRSQTINLNNKDEANMFDKLKELFVECRADVCEAYNECGGGFGDFVSEWEHEAISQACDELVEHDCFGDLTSAGISDEHAKACFGGLHDALREHWLDCGDYQISGYANVYIAESEEVIAVAIEHGHISGVCVECFGPHDGDGQLCECCED